MLSLQLSSFRCWKDLSLSFPLGKITLLRGVSGGGKTTIFAAIAWCLFGNLRLVFPLNNEKAKTAVTLTTVISGQSVTITRCRNPGRLQVKIMDSRDGSEQEYEDKVATTIIEGIFGKYEGWLTSSYLAQGCRNSFLGVSNVAKLQLLEDIAFLQEDPLLYLQKIDEKLNAVEQKYKLHHQQLSLEVEAWNRQFEKLDLKYAITFADLQEVAREKELREVTVEKLRQELISYRVSLQLLQETSHEKELLEKDHVPPPFFDPAEMAAISFQLPLVEEREKQLLLLAKFPPSSTKFTEEDFRQSRDQELLRQQQVSLAARLRVEYTSSAISQKREEYATLCNAQEFRNHVFTHRQLLAKKEKHQRKSKEFTIKGQILEEELRKLVAPLPPKPDYNAYSVDSLQQEVTTVTEEVNRLLSVIDRMKVAANIISCPHCSGSVRYVQKKLVPADTTVQDILSLPQQEKNLAINRLRLQTLNAEISRRKAEQTAALTSYHQDVQRQSLVLQTLQKKEKEFTEVQRRLQKYAKKIQQEEEALSQRDQSIDLSLVPPPLSAKELAEKQEMLLHLRTMVFLSPPLFSSTTIQQFRERQRVEETIALLSAQITFFENSSQLRSRLHQGETAALALHDYQHRQERLVSLTKKIDELQGNLSRNVEAELTAAEELVQSLTCLHQEYSQMYLANKGLEELTASRDQLSSLHQELCDYYLLRQKARDCECTILQSVVDSINNSVTNICEDLFNSDISMKLQLFKEVKSTKEVKAAVNFNIAYREGIFENINQMSGGEGDRASLALTLGLNALSTCPFLLLDETLASLDGELKMEAVSAISANTNKTVILIMHDGVEGIFDSVVDVDELSGKY